MANIHPHAAECPRRQDALGGRAEQARHLPPFAKLLDPLLGVCRGIIDFAESGKGGRDPDDKLTAISFGELREIRAALGVSVELFATLERLAEQCPECCGSGSVMREHADGFLNDPCDLCGDCRDVLAKARGEA